MGIFVLVGLVPNVLGSGSMLLMRSKDSKGLSIGNALIRCLSRGTGTCNFSTSSSEGGTLRSLISSPVN